MTDKLPWFPLYAAKFSTDERVLAMTYEAEGVYNAVLRHQWIHGDVPIDPAALRRVLVKPISDEALNMVLGCLCQDSSHPSRGYNKKLRSIQERRSRDHSRLSEYGRKGGMAKALRMRSLGQVSAKARLKPGSSIASASNASTASVDASTPVEAEILPPGAHKRVTWLTPFILTHEQTVGGPAPAKQMAGVFKGLLRFLKKQRPDATVESLTPEVCAQQRDYLDGLVIKGEINFLNYPKWASTYGGRGARQEPELEIEG